MIRRLSSTLDLRVGAALFFCLIVIAARTSAQEHHAPAASPAHAAAHDTATHAQQSHGEGEHGNVIGHILEHKVADTPFIDEYPFPELHLPQFAPIHLGALTIDLSFSRHLMYLWFASLLTVVLLWIAARQNARKPVPKGFGNMIEAVIVFIRDEIATPVLGHSAKKYLPLLLTFFFFIAITNLLGLLPWSATATGNINVTASLALISFGMMMLGGMRHNGLFGFFKGLIPHGIPAWLIPLMFVIEIIGLLTKPFALTVRLFANMLSGGLVIGAFYGLIFGLHTIFIAPVSLGFLLFMTLLKIFVCLLQAYIFTMLSTFFLSMAVHQGH